MEMNESTEEHVSFGYELVRKGIHICSLSIPIVYYLLDKVTMLWLLIPVTILFVTGDVLRLYSKRFFNLYKKIFGRLLRTHEKTHGKKTFNGASWVLLAATLCILVFPKLIAITAIAILIISDTTAALVGRRCGGKKFRDKTLAGSTAFVVSAAIVILFTPKITYQTGEYLIAIASSIVGAVSEVLSFDIIDDNFAIPVSIGISLWILYAIFYPQLDISIIDM